MKIELEKKGTIEIKGGIIIGDPCYTEICDFISIGKNTIPNGTYDCYVGNTIEQLPNGYKHHLPVFMHICPKDSKFKLGTNLLGWVSVDSGTMSISTTRKWASVRKLDEKTSTRTLDDNWYERTVCNEIDENNGSVITDNGKTFMCISGYVDGMYSVFTNINGNGKITDVTTYFIQPDDNGYEI